MKKCCCFCGHRDIFTDGSVRNKISSYVEQLIDFHQVDTFYSGGMGSFDHICESVVRELKQEYPHVRLYLVIPYLTKFLFKYKDCIRQDYDEVIFPNLERSFYKAAIQKRNRWMIQNSDYMIAYMRHHYGGVRQSYNYAQKLSIMIKNFA